MKKKFAFLLMLFAILLSACNMPQSATTVPTASESDLATQIAKVLTQMPTATGQSIVLPTAASTATQAPTAPITENTATTEPTAAATLLPTGTVQPTATPTQGQTASPSLTPPATDPVLSLGDPDYRDNMDQAASWPLDDDKYLTVDNKDGYLIMTAVSTVDGWRLSVPTFDDAYVQATVKTGTCSGSDHYGIIFRVPNKSTANAGYLFGFTCDGRYSLREWDGSTMTYLVNWTESSAIVSGSNAVNRLGIMAIGSDIALYANGTLLKTVQDSTYTNGSFGMFVGSDETDNFTINVDEVAYWNK